MATDPHFGPRAVPPSSWRRWLAAGVALTTRRVGAFVMLGAAGAILHAVPAGIGLGVMAVPLVLGLGCLVAECGDHARPVLGALRDKPLRVHARLALIGVAFGLGTWIAGILVVLFAGAVGVDPTGVPLPSTTSSRSLAEALCASWLLSAGVTLFGGAVVLGLLVPLVALGELPVGMAFVQAIAAIRLNPFVVFATAALACTAVVGLVTPFLAIPWTAIVSATLYVAYRDVFLGRSDNAPLPAGRAATAPALGA